MPLATFFKSILSENQKRVLRSIKRSMMKFAVSSVSHDHNLSALAVKHGTDKYEHGFTQHYQEHFKHLRDMPIDILEIGIGAPGDPHAGGASLRMWNEYFPKARIYAIDIEDKSPHEQERIKIYRGSQNDTQFLDRVASEVGGFDIIIDDGSHINEHILTSFTVLFPFLRIGGLYVIEDLQTSYWSDYGGNPGDLNDPATGMGMLKQLIDGINHQFIPNRSDQPHDKEITGVHIYRNIAFINKENNDNPPSAFTLKHVAADTHGTP